MNAPFSMLSAFLLLFSFGCTGAPGSDASIDAPPSREDAIPPDAVKIMPSMDAHPPILHSEEWQAPIPLGAPVNSAGAEDSPFITPDGNKLYFFFTPDVRVPVERQILDNVTGIWVSEKSNGAWGEPVRVRLQDKGKLALDGCEFVRGETIWFCSAREGYEGIHWFVAQNADGKWGGWKNADFDPSYEVGELHISADGKELYFHSARAGGKTGLDIWASTMEDGTWGNPVNVEAVNTPDNEGWPFLSQGGNELWFTRFYQGSPAVFRSKRASGTWSEPELIMSQFAGEPALDNAGNIYFVHHYYRDGKMLEADIYVAYKKT